MKKITLFASFLFMCIALSAQTQPPTNLDTLSCDTLRRPHFFYPEWFDTCPWFLDPYHVPGWEVVGGQIDSFSIHFRTYGSANPPDTVLTIDPRRVRNYAFQMYTPTPIRARGIWAMVSQSLYRPDYGGTYDYVVKPDKLPEYVYLYLPDTSIDWAHVNPEDYGWESDHLILIDSVRWDTLRPKMICLPTSANAIYGYQYCMLYEIPLDTIVTIDGEFWVGGSTNSNERGGWPAQHAYTHFPTFYLSWGVQARYYNAPYRNYAHGYTGRGPWIWCFGDTFTQSGAGPFGLIIDDQWTVEVNAADPTQGSTHGSCRYSDSTTLTISAIPNPTYRFSHWNDGDTNNPRNVFITQDTVFTAFFERVDSFSVHVVSNDITRGSVDGEGTYYAGEVAELWAFNRLNYHFSHWNDGNTEHPRQIVVTQDTSFTAFFEPDNPAAIDEADAPTTLFTLTPNPTDGRVSVEVKSDKLKDKSGVATITVCDATGREVLKQKASILNSPLSILNFKTQPAGTYFVTVTIGGQSGTRKLVVK